MKTYSSTDVYGINRPFQKHSKIGLFPLAAFSGIKQSSSSSSSLSSTAKSEVEHFHLYTPGTLTTLTTISVRAY